MNVFTSTSKNIKLWKIFLFFLFWWVFIVGQANLDGGQVEGQIPYWEQTGLASSPLRREEDRSRHCNNFDRLNNFYRLNNFNGTVVVDPDPVPDPYVLITKDAKKFQFYGLIHVRYRTVN